MKNKFSEIRLTESIGDDGSGWQGHLRLRKHYEERQRNTYQHSMFGKQFSMAERKRKQSLGHLGKEKEWKSSTLRDKVKRQARVNLQKTLYTSVAWTTGIPPIFIPPFSTVIEPLHY